MSERHRSYERRIASTDINLAKLIRVGKPQFSVPPRQSCSPLSLPLSRNTILSFHPPLSLSLFPLLPDSPGSTGIISLIRTRLAETAERGYRWRGTRETMVRGWRRFTWQVKHPTACNILAGHACKIPSRPNWTSNDLPLASPLLKLRPRGEPMGGRVWIGRGLGSARFQCLATSNGRLSAMQSMCTSVKPCAKFAQVWTGNRRTQLDHTVIRTRWRDRCLGIIIIDRSGEGFRV